MASDHARTPQHAPKIILGALLSRTLDIKIARLVLIFNLILVLHFPPKEKCFIVTHFETAILLLSKLVLRYKGSFMRAKTTQNTLQCLQNELQYNLKLYV